MANTITDNRILVDNADSVGAYTDLAGAGAGSLDTEIFIQGSGSIGNDIGSARDGILFDAGTAQDWANQVFYIWINCGIVGLLDIKANAGFAIRFAAATTPANNYIEFNVGGSDFWPASVNGGWTMFVVDIEATPSTTVGTLNTNAVRYVGWSGITGGTMPRMVDNTWMDEIRRLPDGTPGIIIEGRNGGTTDWNSADIVTELGIATGTFILTAGGAYKINTPIQFGVNDTVTHGFTDTNQIWLWDDQEFLPNDLYKLSALGNSGGITNVTMGLKSGTGDDATGSQGITFAAASVGVRWNMDFNDPDLDAINLYGCNFIHGGDFLLNDVAVSIISSFYIDCSSALVSNSEQLRVSVVNANTLDSIGFMSTDDLSDIVFSTFAFSDGHAVVLLASGPTTQASKGNLFTGYLGTPGSNLTAGPSGSTDAAISNDNGAATILNITDSGDTPSVRNETGTPSTTVNNTVTLSVTASDSVGDPINGAQVRIEETNGTLVSSGTTNASGLFEDTGFSFGGDLAVVIKIRSSPAGGPRFIPFRTNSTIINTGLTVEATLLPDNIAA